LKFGATFADRHRVVRLLHRAIACCHANVRRQLSPTQEHRMNTSPRRTLLAAVLGGCLGLCFAGLGADAQGGGKAVEITPAAFAKDWKADARAVQKKYHGKTVTFTGPIFGFSIDITHKPGIRVRCEPGESAVTLTAYPKEAEPWTQYGIGQTITVKGVFNADQGAVVQNATITTKEKNPTVTLKAADLAADATPSRDEAAKKYMDQGVIVVGEVAKINDQKDVVYLQGKDGVLIECLMYPVVKPQLGASLTVGKEARVFGVVKAQLSPILDESKNFRLRDCLPILGAKKS
jgi:hypothetical protein